MEISYSIADSGTREEGCSADATVPWFEDESYPLGRPLGKGRTCFTMRRPAQVPMVKKR